MVSRRRRQIVVVWVAALVVLAGMASEPTVAQDRTWFESLPDPDGFFWESPDRPGYRYRGMTDTQQRFYDYVQDKRMRGAPLSWAERAMILSLQAARRWPEAPRPNPAFRAYINYLREQPPEQLNIAHRLMLAHGMALGVVPADPQVSPDTTRRLVEYLDSGPFRARNWFERCFGRVEPWMEFVAAAQGIDVTGGGGGGGGGVESRALPPDGGFNTMRIQYNVSGATLDEPTDDYGFTYRRSHRGVVHPGTLTVSGTAEAKEGGVPKNLRVRVWAHTEEQVVQETLGGIDGGSSTAFSVSVPVPPGTQSAGFTIHLGFHSPYGSRALDLRASLKQSEADAAAQREHADALWREEVERVHRELGSTRTPAGREADEMREALAGGDAAWRAYVDRKQRELGYQDGPREAAFDQLASALNAGGPTWQQYAAAHGGTPDAPRPAPTPAVPETRTLDSELHGALFLGDIDRIRSLLDQGANIHAPARGGRTHLHVAAMTGEPDICIVLIERGADVHARTDEGQTPLHWAAGSGETAASALLIERGADVNARDGEGRTPLDLAMAEGKTDTIALLRARGGREGKDAPAPAPTPTPTPAPTPAPAPAPSARPGEADWIVGGTWELKEESETVTGRRTAVDPQEYAITMQFEANGRVTMVSRERGEPDYRVTAQWVRRGLHYEVVHRDEDEIHKVTLRRSGNELYIADDVEESVGWFRRTDAR